MARKVRITAIRNEEPNLGLYVMALIALARQIQEEERDQQLQSSQETDAAEGSDAD